jgi:nucleotide-binding universal stress UspA family protein
VIGAAHRLARHAGTQLRVLTVVQPTLAMYAWTEAGTAIRPARDIDDIEGEYRALAERELRQAVASVDDVEIDVSAFVGDPVEVIVEISPRLDLLVCGSRGYGPLRAVLLGSVSRQLVTESRCPVVVLPRGVTGALERLFAGTAAAAR